MMLVAVDRARPDIPIVTLDDPARYNALSGTLLTDLQTALADLRLDRDARAIVLRGAGKGFCAGADLSGGGRQEPAPGAEGRGKVGALLTFQQHLSDTVLAIAECPKPVIAAVHGGAIGGGLSVALACDLRVCSTDARFSARFVRVGLSGCDMGASWLLPRIVGSARAAELLYTGRDFGGEEAERIGLVHRVVAPQVLLDVAIDTAARIAANSEYSVWATKVGLAAALEAPTLRHSMELENRIQVIGAMTGNLVEAAEAFQEKREPTWRPL